MAKAEIIIPRRYSFWINAGTRRVFQVIDTPIDGVGTIVLLEIQEYKPDDPHKIQELTPVDWMLLTADPDNPPKLKPYNIRI